jgi:hypothetical protein
MDIVQQSASRGRSETESEERRAEKVERINRWPFAIVSWPSIPS